MTAGSAVVIDRDRPRRGSPPPAGKPQRRGRRAPGAPRVVIPHSKHPLWQTAGPWGSHPISGEQQRTIREHIGHRRQAVLHLAGTGVPVAPRPAAGRSAPRLHRHPTLLDGEGQRRAPRTPEHQSGGPVASGTNRQPAGRNRGHPTDPSSPAAACRVVHACAQASGASPTRRARTRSPPASTCG